MQIVSKTWNFLFKEVPVPRILWFLVLTLILIQATHTGNSFQQLENQQKTAILAEVKQQQQLEMTMTTVAILDKENNKRQETKKQILEYLKENCSRSPSIKTRIPVIQGYILYASDLYDIRPQLIAELLVSESSCDNKALNESTKSKGLMQVHPVHKPDVFINDLENIIKGTAILRDCLDKWGNIEPKAVACFKGVKNIQ
jgi:soluble lytic murein transglycosylase-like protein